jgi:hypothetical protein
MLWVRRWRVALLVALGLLLVGCSAESEANAQEMGSSFASFLSAGADWLASFGGSENGEWLGYAVAAILLLAVWRRWVRG